MGCLTFKAYSDDFRFGLSLLPSKAEIIDPVLQAREGQCSDIRWLAQGHIHTKSQGIDEKPWLQGQGRLPELPCQS